MQDQVTAQQTAPAAKESTRLHYLDWLRVLAILMVFLYHAVHPFDTADWHIKNAETSMGLTAFLGFFYPWGMPFFFLIAGTGSWFALRRRTAGQYAKERVKRLLVPYIAGSILLWPIMLYLQWLHITRLPVGQDGAWQGTFMQFVLLHHAGFTPRWFGEVGFHLWFLGFLFSFSLLGLPLFMWLKRKSGQAFLSWLARVCMRRGGILVFIVPLLVVRLVLQPFFPLEHDWADFMYLMTFFALGYVLYAREEFQRAIRRDWAILLGLSIVSTFAWAYLALSIEDFSPYTAPHTLKDIVLWIAVATNGWCWTTFVLFIGMHYLNFTNRWLEYGQEAVLPFFMLHQPVIMAIAFFVVQWSAGIPIKLVTVVAGSFIVTVAIYELIVRRIGPLRTAFGMKGRPGRPLAPSPGR
jgi:peptidoglycan/LPS O-acetylase OafA/YrhL